ncbi:MAG: hypothetical protein ACI4WS_01960 [Oscillospiraceae bacterium]
MAKTHTMKQDADLLRGNTNKPKDVHLHNELHPDDRKSGKGAKESKQFNENCSFNINRTK